MRNKNNSAPITLKIFKTKNSFGPNHHKNHYNPTVDNLRRNDSIVRVVRAMQMSCLQKIPHQLSVRINSVVKVKVIMVT